MIKILFICHGNICRSPMAQYIFQNMVNEEGVQENFFIDSAATTYEEIGNPIYPPAKKKLKEKGIAFGNHAARHMTVDDYEVFDLLIGMDTENILDMRRFYRNDPDQKIHLLMDYAGENRDVADPWYTRDFEATWNDLHAGCKGLFQNILGI